MRRQKYLLGALSGICAVIGLAAVASTSAPSGEPTPASSAVANQPSFQSVKKQLEVFNDRPSTDSVPIDFDKGSPKYRIPRNYIVNGSVDPNEMDNLLTLRVTFPGFKPLTDETRDCLTKAPLYRPKGCEPIDVWIGVNSRNEGPSHPLTDEQKFKNASQLFPDQRPKPGPDGFEMYEIGPDNAHTEYYRKQLKDRTIFIYCGLIQVIDGKRWAQCDDHFSPLPNGGAISYRFHLDQVDHAEEIDTGLRNLVLSFTIEESKP